MGGREGGLPPGTARRKAVTVGPARPAREVSRSAVPGRTEDGPHGPARGSPPVRRHDCFRHGIQIFELFNG